MYTDVLGLVLIHLAHGTLCVMQCCLVDTHTYQAVKALSPDLRVAGVLPNSFGEGNANLHRDTPHSTAP